MQTVTIKSEIRASIRNVWNTVTTPDNHSWRSGINRIVTHDGQNFTEYTTNGYATHFTVIVSIPYRCYKLYFENKNLNGHWTGVFHETIFGTEIEFTESVQVRKWWMRPFAGIYLKKQQAVYLADLKKACEK